jgi:hypothetical protein
MPARRVRVGLGVRSGDGSRVSQPQARGQKEGYCSQAGQSFHVINDMKVTIGVKCTIDTEVSNDTTVGSSHRCAAGPRAAG